MDETMAWAAGFFDGEGSVNIARVKNQRSGYSYHVLDATVAQVDPRPLLFLKEQFGGAISAKAPSTARAQPSFRWTIRNKGAENFLRAIQPWCRVKGEQIDIALAFREIKAKTRGGRVPRDEEVFVSREAFKQQLESSRRAPSKETS